MTAPSTTTATAPACSVSVVLGDDPGNLPAAAHDIARAYLAEALSGPARFLNSREIRRLPHLTRRTFTQGMRALVSSGLYVAQPTPTGWHVHITVPTPITITCAMSRPLISRRQTMVGVTHHDVTRCTDRRR